MHDFKDLSVWRESVAVIPDIYALTARFPIEERMGLSAEIRRTSVAVSAHIAEGESRPSRREFLNHLFSARGSLARLETLLLIADQLGYLAPPELETLQTGVAGIARPLNGLIAKLRRDLSR